MAEQFNIKEIIERYKLDTNEVAEALFPHVRYKMLALNRVLKGEAFLDTQQVEVLAKLAGVFIHELFTYNSWKGSYQDGHITMTCGDYKVKLNYNGVFMTLTKGPKVIKQELTCPKAVSISDFIEHINQIIKNQNNGNN